MANRRVKQRAETIALTKSLKQARMGEYQATTDGLSALFGNLGTTLNGRARSLTSSNARKLAALQKLDARTVRRTQGAIDNARGSASKLFGSAAAGGAGYLFDQGQGHADAAATAQAGLTKAGGVISRGSQEGLGIVAAGAAAAQAGATAMTADALTYRAQQDAALIAERKNTILSARLDFQNWKKQQEYLRKQEEGDSSKAGVGAVTDTAVDAAVFFRRELTENPTATATELVEAYTAQYGQLNENEALVLTTVARAAMRSTDDATGTTVAGYDRKDEANAIVDALLLLYPNYKDVKGLRENVLSGLNAGWSSAQVAAIAAEEAGGGDGQGVTGQAPTATSTARPAPDGTPPPRGARVGHWETQNVYPRNGGAGHTYYTWVEESTGPSSTNPQSTDAPGTRGVTSH